MNRAAQRKSLSDKAFLPQIKVFRKNNAIAIDKVYFFAINPHCNRASQRQLNLTASKTIRH